MINVIREDKRKGEASEPPPTGLTLELRLGVYKLAEENGRALCSKEKRRFGTNEMAPCATVLQKPGHLSSTSRTYIKEEDTTTQSCLLTFTLVLWFTHTCITHTHTLLKGHINSAPHTHRDHAKHTHYSK